MNHIKPLPRKQILISTAFLLLGFMVIGTFADYPISKVLYNQSNPFGLFFAAFGEYPAALGIAAAGAMLLVARNREKRFKSVLQIFAGGWFILSGAAMAAMLPKGYLEIPTWLSVGIGLTCTGLTVWGTFCLCNCADRSTAIRVAVTVLLVIFTDIILVNVIKVPWGRARMRLVAVDERVCFMPWWQLGSGLKETLIAAGVPAEEFKSFPSGHTANASALMLLCLIPMLRTQLAKKQNLLFGIGLFWTALVALSRIMMGAHYLTDTVVGFAIGLGALVGVSHSVFHRTASHDAKTGGCPENR